MKRLMLLLALLIGFAMASETASAWGGRGYYRGARPYYGGAYGPGAYRGYYRAPYYPYYGGYYGNGFYGPGVGVGVGVY